MSQEAEYGLAVVAPYVVERFEERGKVDLIIIFPLFWFRLLLGCLRTNSWKLVIRASRPITADSVS